MGRIAATELMPDFTGRILDNGRFELREALGAGAYGKVYRAMEAPKSSSNKPKYYAVKCLNKPAPGSHTDVLQQREFSLHKLVSGHPNIVTFHEAFSDEHFVYVVLDLCPGGDLFSAITEKRLFHNNGRLIKSTFIQLIDAVQHCHDLGVFHRDIKPENVLCSYDGTDIRLADFGLSIKSPLCHDFGCGSSYYMSPECIGREVRTGNYSTRHNDVWALAVILTNMVTGRNPWRYATGEDDCFAAFMKDNDFLKQALPISSGVNTILKKVFVINPLRRMTLPTMRRKILELNAFFMDDRDISGKAIIPAKAHASTVRCPPSSILLVSSSESTSSDEQYVFPSPVDQHPELEANPHLKLPHANVLRASNLGDFIIGGTESTHSLRVPSSAPSSGPSSASSGLESKGPITPATHPVHPDLSVPEILEDEGLGPPADNLNFIAKIQAPITTVKAKRPRTHIFRTALQRIKALSGSGSS
ncbi:Pkinase-domain-containing protein [Pholiota conissans]|uniref:Pkinase-domain-containing protein n=1 Tax=Pholiota conissans TaxID=109636 RepID=A0A9P5ZAQ2_9AGAR|nr:Pkinase-domain-containing protein [Pholiota conissans]